jgi:hypothetical protein
VVMTPRQHDRILRRAAARFPRVPIFAGALIESRRCVKCALPWWSRALGRRLAQRVYDAFRLRAL